MRRVAARFDSKLFAIVVTLDTTITEQLNLYNKLLAYLINNMFISFRPQASRLRKVLLSSVGDHLDENDEQRISEADLWLYLDLDKSTPVTADMMSAMDKFPTWYIVVEDSSENKMEPLNILIRKTDGFILRDSII